MEVRDRAIGSILGLAVGDALGAPFEFEPRDSIPDPLPAFELPWRDLPPGSWTDDTAMARNLWTSLIANDGVLDLDDLLVRHLAWFAGRPPDVGTLTARVLTRYGQGDPDAARWYVETKGPEVSAGNGAVMYCAPLGVVRARDPQRLLTEAPALAALTHWDERCRTSCLAVTLAIAALVAGEEAAPAVIEAVRHADGLDGAEELEYLVDEAGRARQIDRRDIGFTLFTAGVALQVTGEGRGFEDGLRYVVSLGGDTDTNAAVAGALLG
ncbi:MAG TPA: ADP-ribosylglycohydrolase family protein, partial [Actinomycetota bacterium]|nr:ADP-ribosylglycohydrolase family protein [Actinomycetota bacterium]